MVSTEKQEKINKITWIIAFISFVIPIIYLSYKIIILKEDLTNINGEHTRTQGDYILMILQCLLGVVAIILPSKLAKKMKIEIPTLMYFFYTLFLYGAIFLGEVRSFYYIIPQWDTVLHLFSGGMIGIVGFSIVSLLNHNNKTHVYLSPFFVAFFAFCFAITLGTMWEVYEYLADGLLGLNMQKFALSNGTDLVGRIALSDTMDDLIVDTIGALSMCIVGYISLKYKTGWIERMIIKKKKM